MKNYSTKYYYFQFQCCIKCHALGSAIITLAHDYRIMNSSYGFFSMPEIHHKIPMTPCSTKLIKSKILNPNTFRDILYGKHYTGKEASSLQFIDVNDLNESVLLAQKLTNIGKDRITLKSIKSEMYKQESKDLTINNLGFISIKFSKL